MTDIRILTVPQLAEVCGVGRQTVSKWCKDRTYFTPFSLPRAAGSKRSPIYLINLDDALRLVNHRTPDPQLAAQQAANLRRLARRTGTALPVDDGGEAA